MLAVAAGVLMSVASEATSGDAGNANSVRVRHTRIERSGPAQLPIVVELPYVSRYLHLAGPNAIPVSPGMSVRQGARLGAMDDTGYSTIDHLHFCLHDDRVGGASVPPTPMEGVALLPGDGGKCIESTNVAFP